MTIIGPTPLLAANFVLLGQIIPILGSQYSRLTAKTCEYVYFPIACLSLNVLFQIQLSSAHAYVVRL